MISGLPAGDDVLAVGIIERHFTLRRPGFAKTNLTLEELALRIDQRDQRDGRVQDARRQAGQTVEGRVGGRIEQAQTRADALDAPGLR